MSDNDEYTVVFFGHPRNIKGNPFDTETEFGRVVVLSIGNVCEDSDVFRDALQQIADGCRNAEDVANAALDAREAAMKAALDRRSAARQQQPDPMTLPQVNTGTP